MLLALAACGRGASDLPDVTVELSVAPEPPQIGPATITVSLRGADNEPLTGASVQLEGNMSHAGMVPVFAQAMETAPGLYEANLEFTMGGDWFILVQAILADGRSMERKVDLPGVDVYCSDTPSP
jgi:hypothetical protein